MANPDTRRIIWLHSLFFFSGFPALFYQIVWQRSLFALYGTNIESVTIVVIAFMLGLGLGSLLGGCLSKVAERFALRLFGTLELGIGVFGLFSLSLFHWIGTSTIQASYLEILGLSFALTCIPTFFMGMTLPLIVAYLIRLQPHVGQSVGSLYCVNTLGSGVACFLLAFFVMRVFGQQGTVELAAGINIFIGSGALLISFKASSTSSLASFVPVREKKRADIPLLLGLLLSGLSGYIALSYELIWIRLYSVLSGGRAYIFATVLAYYLTGIGAGSWLSRSYTKNPRRVLAFTSLLISLCGFLLIPFIAWIVQYQAYTTTFVYIGLISILLGFNLPLLSEGVFCDDSNPGSGVSYLYFANIIGCIAGSFVTGFILLDFWSLEHISIFLASLGFLLTSLLAWRIGLFCFILVGFLWQLSPLLFNHVYEKLIYKTPYQSSQTFSNIIENKQGVITVSQDKIVYGGGVYDGKLEINLMQDHNLLLRALAIGAFHPAPKDVLMIGLSSGSWAQVIANHPDVEKLTIIEINPGYLNLIKQYPIEAPILSNPKVQIIIDDGRQWLKRNPSRHFDLIVMNTTFYWRDHVSNLLSKEYLDLVKQELKPGGIFYYNTTSSKEAIRTGIVTYPYAVRVMNFLAVSDSPIHLDKQRWRSLLKQYTINGKPLLNLKKKAGQDRLEQMLNLIGEMTFRDSLLRETRGTRTITDDNMGSEWTD
jgi:predicted membrane-bound spermidine synthase